MKPPSPSKAATAAVRAIWANLADRAGLECLGEVEQRTAQHMRKELAAIIDRQMASKWQPISTAPEEGAWALVFSDGAMNCMFVKRGQLPKDWTNATAPNIYPEDVTHWQPLPAPPTK